MFEAELEVLGNGGGHRFTILEGRTTIGKGATDLVLKHRTVSRLHAAIETVTGGWVVQDLGSRNGTFVNGARISGPHALHTGDELRLGEVRVSFRSTVVDESLSQTSPMAAPPRLTNRERDALVALCRPVLSGSMLDEPASVSAIAAELVVSESAAKKLLARTYDKFSLTGGERRRGRLVAEALRSGAVSVADLD
jgi:pSer/pThr/pTyr-binding forkhead associated (FHA) protein